MSPCVSSCCLVLAMSESCQGLEWVIRNLAFRHPYLPAFLSSYRSKEKHRHDADEDEFALVQTK